MTYPLNNKDKGPRVLFAMINLWNELWRETTQFPRRTAHVEPLCRILEWVPHFSALQAEPDNWQLDTDNLP